MSRPPLVIAPSILAADFARLGDEVRRAEKAGADWIHLDVMDGHFVPNLTIGPPVIRALKSIATVPLDVHLMIDDADRTVQWYLEAGADMITVHAEAVTHLHRVIQTVRAAGVKAGVALNPATPASVLSEVVADLDLVLVMSVNPGFGGQAFIPGAVGKVREIAAMVAASGSDALIEVDGGVDATTAPLVTAAGARMLVAGNAIFGAPDPARALRTVRDAGAAVLAG
jgi:ribulose-phosphate 3-epimerase